MPSNATIRFQVESALAHKFPSALTPPARMVRPVVSSGIGALDDLSSRRSPIYFSRRRPLGMSQWMRIA